MAAEGQSPVARPVGRYTIHEEIASGGMATVHLGRLNGAAGFARTVAIKRMHSELAKDPEFVSMFVDEARLAARIYHPNVVATLDVVALAGELLVVMEYVHGESLAVLARTAKTGDGKIPLRIAMRISAELLAGLHAAHEAKNEAGEPLGIVHRDVSPQNVLVGADGTTRIIDFGVAKAAGRLQTTRDGQIKGKISYMSREQLLGEKVDRRSDVYSASAVIWEMLAGTRLFQGQNQGHTMQRVLAGDFKPPSQHTKDLPPAIDAAIMKGLSSRPEDRFDTALEMALALDAASPHASTHEVAEWIKQLVGDGLRARSQKVSKVESSPADAGTEIDAPNSNTQSDVSKEAARLVIRAPEIPIELPTSTSISASLSASAPPPPPKRPMRAIVASSAVVVFLLGLSIYVMGPKKNAAPVAPAVASAAPSISISPPMAAALPPATTDEKIAASATALPTTPSARPTASSARPKPHATPALNCNPPFVVDARGVRTYKRECLTP
jgi:serine/threonine-protein kinase